MTFQITLQPSGYTFTADDNESILDAALRQGFILPHACRDGACGTCRCTIIQGEIEHGKTPQNTLSDKERQSGLALICCAKARSDLSIEAKEARRANDISIRTLPARVQEMYRAAEGVMILKLRLPANELLTFYPGQYIDILLQNGKRRSFSLANTPQENGLLELHVRHIPGGQFTEHVFTRMKEKDILRINGPHGTFFLRETSKQPIIMLAGGTGFAPIKAMINAHLAKDSPKDTQSPIQFYWGGHCRADLYQYEEAAAWAIQHPHIGFIPVLSAATQSDQWSGRTGLVHQAVMADYPDLSTYQVYACGSPAMIRAAHNDFCSQCHLPQEAFFADAFEFAHDA